MARSTINKVPADPFQTYLQGVAKSLADRMYGPEGPAWGTHLTEIEDIILAIREVLGEKTLSEILRRQAAAKLPADYRNCPSCGKEVEPDKPDERTVQSRIGEAQWQEPSSYCRKCRRSFFPSDEKFRD